MVGYRRGGRVWRSRVCGGSGGWRLFLLERKALGTARLLLVSGELGGKGRVERMFLGDECMKRQKAS